MINILYIHLIYNFHDNLKSNNGDILNCSIAMGQDGSVENFKRAINKTNKHQSAFYYYSGNTF